MRSVEIEMSRGPNSCEMISVLSTIGQPSTDR